MKCELHNYFCFGYSVEKVGSARFNFDSSLFWNCLFTAEKNLVNTSSHQNTFGGNWKFKCDPHKNYEPLEIKCNFQGPSLSELSLKSDIPKNEPPMPRYSTTDHWMQESIKRSVLGSQGCREKKKLNCHKYATFEASFLCFHGQKNILIFF